MCFSSLTRSGSPPINAPHRSAAVRRVNGRGNQLGGRRQRDHLLGVEALASKTLTDRLSIRGGVSLAAGRRVAPAGPAKGGTTGQLRSVMICHRVVVCPQASRPRAYIAPEADAEPH